MTDEELMVLARVKSFYWRDVAEELRKMVTVLEEKGGKIIHMTEEDRHLPGRKWKWAPKDG